MRFQTKKQVCGLLFTLMLFFVTNCKTAEIKPEEFVAEDVCTHCKMAISEKQFAAEFFTPEGDVRKFDDIGCMVDYLQANVAVQPATYFFVDYETKKWIKGTAAIFMKSNTISTPMYGGIVAFDEKTRAEAAALKFKGKISSLEELTKR